MQTRNRNTFTAIHTEGALLPVDLLQRISENNKNLEGLNPESYHLAPGEKLTEAINRSWNRLSGLWGAFQAARGRLGSSDAGTTLTRERWLLPLFQELGFGRLSTSKAVEIEGKSYPISHRWQNVPLHLVGCGIEMDKRTPGAAGAARTSPHSLMQEYLNRSDDVQWGVISNGLGLRILRDNATLTRQAYIEFDLESMFDGEIYSDFVLLWLICHQSRFETTEKQTECLLEKWSKSAQESGTRALDDLRRGVEEAIVSFGQGFLQQPLNGELRSRLKNGDLSAQDYYRQLLRLVYRLIFLFAAEDRDLLLLPGAAVEARQRFQNYYSTTRLRALAQRQRGSRHHDRFEALRLVMTLLGSDSGCPELAIPALGGFLFDARSTADLNNARLDNQALLSAVRSLAFITEGNTRRAVDYRNLGPEELGSVYESLLELHPLLNTDAGTFQLTSAAGNERKTTGSYYTPSSLIQVLLDSALDPVIEDRVGAHRNAPDHQEQALLELKVCDPACGSGHFLIAAAHRIAGNLAEVRAGDNEPSPNETRRALRDVIRHCIYGVDINPMAVELCKVNLWLESLEPGKPLSFLDAHIQCGDSLVGVSAGLDISEIPDEAFNVAFGDDKATCAGLKKRNKSERSGQFGLFGSMGADGDTIDALHWLAERAAQVDAMPEDNLSQVQIKAQAFTELQDADAFHKKELEYNLWTAAFFWHIPKDDTEVMLAPTQQALVIMRTGNVLKHGLVECAQDLAKRLNFLHWELRFPKVFTGNNPGFDCILGNPPWDTMQIEEVQFFSIRDPEISDLSGKKRKEKIEKLIDANPSLAEEFYAAKHLSDAKNKFIRFSGRYPLTTSGKLNTDTLFTEHSYHSISTKGRVGLIVPIGITTEDSTKEFFNELMTTNSLVESIGFENEEFLFPGIANVVRFCTIIIARDGNERNLTKFAFYLRRINQLKEHERFFTLSPEEVRLVNPNTLTCPVFRTQTDAKLTLDIYRRTPIINNEVTGQNPWEIKFMQGLFNLTSDSGLFVTNKRLNDVSLYEAKMLWFYDHRFSSYDLKGKLKGKGGRGLPDMPVEYHQNPSYSITPQYWVSKTDVITSLPKEWKNEWLIAFRRVSSAKLERTAVFSYLPLAGVGNSAQLIFATKWEPPLLSCFVANCNSLVFDFIARQKIAGTDLNFFFVKQFPILPPNAYTIADIDFIAPRVLELVFTAYDMRPFAEDMGYHGEPFIWDEERRSLLRAELDAYYANLYGLTRDELRYILDPQDVHGPNFPGETFRVLKEKEIKFYGEYRTRRLVLEAWDRLEGVEIGNPNGYSAQSAAVSTRQETIIVAQPRPESRPAAVRTQFPAPAKPSLSVTPPDKVVKEIDPPVDQPTLSDFGLYKCEVCGKMVMGFEKANHEQEKHGGKSVDWKKVR